VASRQAEIRELGDLLVKGSSNEHELYGHCNSKTSGPRERRAAVFFPALWINLFFFALALAKKLFLNKPFGTGTTSW
jgi:hypothetical protein